MDPLKSSRRPQRSDPAFTLIELLTVIAIIGILAAIIIPTVGKVRQTAKKAQCASNLRQIGMAFLLYAQENKGKLPYHWAGDSGHPSATDLGYTGWYEIIAKTMGYTADSNTHDGRDYFTCPSAVLPDGKQKGVGWAEYCMSHAVCGLDTATIENASQRIIAGDGKGWDNSSIWDSRPDENSPYPNMDWERHEGGANYVFLDAHVRFVKPAEINSDWLDYIH